MNFSFVLRGQMLIVIIILWKSLLLLLITSFCPKSVLSSLYCIPAGVCLVVVAESEFKIGKKRLIILKIWMCGTRKIVDNLNTKN